MVLVGCSFLLPSAKHDRIPNAQSITRDVMPAAAHFNSDVNFCLQRAVKQIFTLSRDGILITDCTPRITAVNPSFTRITGYSAAEVRGKNPSLLQSGHHALPFYQELWQTLIATGSWRGDIWNRRKSGEEYLEVLTIQAIRNPQNAVLGYLGIFGDLSQVQREQELKIAKQAAEDAANTKAQFLANMSHEIRTPLTAIIGFAETMIDSRQTLAERAHAVDTIIRNGRHLQALLNDVLDFSKIRAKRITLELIETSLPELLACAVDSARAQTAEKGLEFSVHFMPPLPLVVHTDPTRARQIIFNLLSNAIKFTNSGAVRLIVSFAPEQELLQIAVQDTGCGIPDDRLGLLFEPFAQADISTTRQFGGTGLGLSISKELAEHLGGTVQVMSVLGSGSVFTLTLATGPIDSANLVWDLQAFNQSSGVRPVRTVRAPALVGHVLVADDNAANQDLISLYLRRCGVQVVIAKNGQEAVEKAQEAAFDLVLMDMRMPIMGGLDATELLRLTGFDKPIVAISANIDRSDVDAALAAGCDTYLPKPIHLDAFYQMLSYYLPQRDIESKIFITSLAQFDDDPELRQLQADFFAELPQRMALMRAAHAAADWDDLRSQAHQIKGVGSSFGMPELTRLAGAMEFQLLRGDLSEVANLIEDMAHLWPQ
jgi:PAS domain S-box-containing protein